MAVKRMDNVGIVVADIDAEAGSAVARTVSTEASEASSVASTATLPASRTSS